MTENQISYLTKAWNRKISAERDLAHILAGCDHVQPNGESAIKCSTDSYSRCIYCNKTKKQCEARKQ